MRAVISVISVRMRVERVVRAAMTGCEGTGCSAGRRIFRVGAIGQGVLRARTRYNSVVHFGGTKSN